MKDCSNRKKSNSMKMLKENSSIQLWGCFMKISISNLTYGYHGSGNLL